MLCHNSLKMGAQSISIELPFISSVQVILHSHYTQQLQQQRAHPFPNQGIAIKRFFQYISILHQKHPITPITPSLKSPVPHFQSCKPSMKMINIQGSQFWLYIPKIKFIWKSLMELSPNTSSSRPCPAVSPQGDSLFEKYKLGLAHLKAPFRLFDSSCSTCCEQQSDSDSQADRKARGPYRKYTFDEKMQAVQRIQNGQDVKIISKEFGIPRRNLLRWKKNGCQRKEGGGRPTDAALEQLIYDKIKSQELTDERTIRTFAMEASRASSFKASKGWFIKFCHRFAINLDQALVLPDSPMPHESPLSSLVGCCSLSLALGTGCLSSTLPSPLAH